MAVKTVKAIINGSSYDLQYDEGTQSWKATISAPSETSYTQDGHYYPVTIKAEDDAGNVTEKGADDPILGEDLQLRVLEKVAPVISITYPTSDAYISTATPQIEWTVTDEGSGIDADTIKLKIDSEADITGDSIQKESIASGWKCKYTPTEALDDGLHVITFNVSDNDGNAAQAQTISFTVDTVPPVLNITSPTEGYITNNETLVVSGTTNDATSSPVTVTVELNNGGAEKVEVQENGSFTKELTLSEGANVIKIVATDSAGKQTVVTRNVTLSTSAPVIVSVSIVPNPVDAGQTFIITAVVTDN